MSLVAGARYTREREYLLDLAPKKQNKPNEEPAREVAQWWCESMYVLVQSASTQQVETLSRPKKKEERGRAKQVPRSTPPVYGQLIPHSLERLAGWATQGLLVQGLLVVAAVPERPRHGLCF